MILASSRKKKIICWNISWQFLTSDPRFKKYLSLPCQGNHEHVWKRTHEGKREYPVSMIRRLVNGFVHYLRLPQLHMFLSAVFVASLAKESEDNVSPAERDRVRKLIHRLHVARGHVSKTSLGLLLQRRGCPVWMQHMVDQLQCDSCLESSDAQNAQRVSLATPPKLWQALKVDIFQLEESYRKDFIALYMDAACKLSSCSCFLESCNSRQRFELNGATLICHLASDWMQHYPEFQLLISDPGGCFVSNELREWAGVRGIGLPTAPREFHGLTADLENLIRVIKRPARKLADDHPELTLASSVSLACSSHNNGLKTGGYSPFQWAFGADDEGHGFTTTMPFWDWDFPDISDDQISAGTGKRCHQSCSTYESQGELRSGTVFSSWQSDSRSDWYSIQVMSLTGTRSCHHDRVSPTMEWIGALHDRTNWCRLGVSWKPIDQMSSF